MKFKLLILSLFVFSVFRSNAVETDPIAAAKKLGLISYLTTVKALSESKMVYLMSHPSYKDVNFKDKVAAFNSSYNLLRLSVDKLINQLSADLYVRNTLKGYRKINKRMKADVALKNKFAVYEAVLQEIDDNFIAFGTKTYSSAKAGPGLDVITGAVELVHTGITNARDFREKKIQSLTALLKELKLSKLVDLTKPTEEPKAG